MVGRRLQPLVRDLGHDLGQQILVDPAGQLRVGVRHAREVADEHVVAGVVGLGGEFLRAGRRRAPAVVEVQRGAVVDQPQPAVPDQQVRIAPAAVDVGGEGVQPEDAGSLRRVGGVAGVPAERAGQEVDRQVQPDAGGEQILHLFVGLVLADRGVELERTELGNPQSQPPRELPDDHLRHQHLQALTRAAELGDVGSQVACLDDAGQRTPLAQRGHIAKGLHGRDHTGQLR